MHRPLLKAMTVFKPFFPENPTPVQELAIRFVTEQTEYIDEEHIADWCEPRRGTPQLLQQDGPTVKFFNDKLPGENDIAVLCNEITNLTGVYFFKHGNIPRTEISSNKKMNY